MHGDGASGKTAVMGTIVTVIPRGWGQRQTWGWGQRQRYYRGNGDNKKNDKPLKLKLSPLHCCRVK